MGAGLTLLARDVVLEVVNVLSCWWILTSFLVRKDSKGWFSLVGCLLVVPFCCMSVSNWNMASVSSLPLRATINFSLSMGKFLVIATLFEGNRRKKFFLLTVYFMIIIFGDLFAPFGQNLITGDFAGYETGYYVAQNIASATMLFFSLSIKVVRRHKSSLNGRGEDYGIQTIVPLFSCLYMGVILVSSKGLFSGSETVSMLAFMLMNLFLYFAFEHMEGVFAKNQELALKEQNSRLREDYYSKMEIQQKEIRKIKHDLKNQLIAISAYLKQEQDELSEQYRTGNRRTAADTAVADQVEELIAGLSQITQRDFTAHPGLNALLSVKYEQAQQNDIVCDFEVRIPDKIGFAETDLAAVAGNVLDNAIEGCLYCEGNRFIQLKLVYFNRSFILSCENSTDGQVGSLKSRKGNTPDHGHGLSSIHRIAKKYCGDMQYRIENRSFIIEITLFEQKP